MIRLRYQIMLCLMGILIAIPGHCLPPLQLFIDLTTPGGTLRPPAGIYNGPIVINRPITLDGQGQVTIDGQGQGTVLTVKTDNSTIRGLHLTNSGESHDAMDAGLLLAADNTLIEANVIDNVLFGINIKQGNNNIIRRNTISSKPEVTSLRGEGLRMWYSRNNQVEDNQIIATRDLLLTNSSENRIIGNTISDSRISIELIYSPNNEILNNLIRSNDTGIVAIYSDDLTIQGNRIEHIRNVGSSALAIKESSQVVIAENEVVHNYIGLTANSPIFPENILYLHDNHFIFNNVAMYFYGEKGGHVIENNHFSNNLTPVAVSTATSARYNKWQGNYWEDYQGFDRDHDGYGDTPHHINLYADRIWMDRPMTQFFRNTPIMGLIDFIERLAPFSTPDLILTDPKPHIQ